MLRAFQEIPSLQFSKAIPKIQIHFFHRAIPKIEICLIRQIYVQGIGQVYHTLLLPRCTRLLLQLCGRVFAFRSKGLQFDPRLGHGDIFVVTNGPQHNPNMHQSSLCLISSDLPYWTDLISVIFHKMNLAFWDSF